MHQLCFVFPSSLSSHLSSRLPLLLLPPLSFPSFSPLLAPLFSRLSLISHLSSLSPSSPSSTPSPLPPLPPLSPSPPSPLQVKVCFSEAQLEQVCEYPSESSMMATACLNPPDPDDLIHQEKEEGGWYEEEEGDVLKKIIKYNRLKIE